MVELNKVPELEFTYFGRADVSDRLMNDHGLVGTVLRGFLEDMPTQFVALKTNLEVLDRTGVQRGALTIRGAASAMGGKRLEQFAGAIEQAAKRGNLVRERDLWRNLGRGLDAFTAAVAHRIRSGDEYPHPRRISSQ